MLILQLLTQHFNWNGKTFRLNSGSQMQICRMFKNTGAIVVALVLSMLPAAAGNFPFQVSAPPEWDQLFQTTNGWVGADAAYSVPLATNKTLWLFGDTFAGQVAGGERIHCRMIPNSIAIQLLGEAPQFFYPTDQNHNPQPFLKSPDGRTDFRLSDGVHAGRRLFLFAQQVKRTGNSVWGFHSLGTWLASVKNPNASPARWKITTKKMPFMTLADGEDAAFGAETLLSGGYIYIYGYANFQNSAGQNNLILARAPEDKLDHFRAWEYFSNGNWTKDFRKIAPIFSGAPPEGSVSWQPFLKKFVFVYTDGIWGRIVMRTAGAPEGPWSLPVTLYQCPEMRFSRNIFCYAGKGHPELSATNELLISYAANSQAPPEVLYDARLYWPRFIRVTFESP